MMGSLFQKPFCIHSNVLYLLLCIILICLVFQTFPGFEVELVALVHCFEPGVSKRRTLIMNGVVLQTQQCTLKLWVQPWADKHELKDVNCSSYQKYNQLNEVKVNGGIQKELPSDNKKTITVVNKKVLS